MSTTPELNFTNLIHAAGRALVGDQATDAKCYRALAAKLGCSASTMKRWWYEQNAPAGSTMAILRREIETILDEDKKVSGQADSDAPRRRRSPSPAASVGRS